MWKRRCPHISYDFSECRLCPRACRADRLIDRGFCGASAEISIARAALHFGEEPCISGSRGSGTIFFSDCGLRCCFCQNYEVSHSHLGKSVSTSRLADIMLELQAAGAHNINLVTAAAYVPQIKDALDRIREDIKIPIIYNSSGYESLSTLIMLDGYIDAYMPDYKYFSVGLSRKYSAAADYPQVALAAIKEMIRQCGYPRFDADGMLEQGVLIRHLVLPGAYRDSLAVLESLHRELEPKSFLLSLMCQYTPEFLHGDFPELNRRLTSYEYRRVLDRADELGFCSGYRQSFESVGSYHTPDFDFKGV